MLETARLPLLVASLTFVALAAAPASALAEGVAGEATVSAPAGSEAELKASASLRVTGLPVAPGHAVAEDAILIAVDTTELERALADARKRLNAAQSEQRQRAVDQPGRSTSSSASGPPSRSDMMAQAMQDRQNDASRELPELQTRLTQAPLRAPKDGYFVRSLFEVGMSTKKRKPAAAFVPLAKTVLEVRVPAADAASLAGARELVVRSTDEPERAFRGKLEGSTPDGDRMVLRIKPVELPFLALGEPTPVTVAAAP